ncbi:sensor histidine kinase [Cesiribacter andamanensis]|uniref:sensor histidine kinase n=1 Tax=Cesiribacter andamanensis TaxID=649507 RepID=UPI00034A53AB|nr:HAMP domain-containing sensor histidine kinase [Cesiribacter andamanensis]
MRVQDQQKRAVPGLRVSIQNSNYVSTDQQGQASVRLEGDLRLPVRAELEDERWELLRAEYYEASKRVIVLVRRMIMPNEIVAIQLLDSLNQPQPGLVIGIENARLTTDAGGMAALALPVSANAQLQLPDGYRLQSRQLIASTHTLSLILKKEDKLQDPVAAAEADLLVKAYESDFERISMQIEQDRAVYEERNEEVRQEILKIQEKLAGEDITDTQRAELRGYLQGLEKTLEQNSEAMRLSEQRTKDALLQLRNLLVEKDSISRVALGRIQQIEAEKAVVEEAFRKKLLVFAGVTLGLLLLLGVVYFFAFKFRQQKNWLKEVNKRLKAVQAELTQNVHELNLKKAQIEDHNQQLELFVYKASHDIKGPLRSIMGLTQIGLNDVKDTVALEYFGHIFKSTRRLDNLLMDLLKLTKVKQAEVERQEINVHSMLQEIIQSFSNIRHFNLVKIELDLPEDLVMVSDEKLLYSVLQNFVENGIKYCDPYKSEPYLKIAVAQQERGTVFSFKDNGLGVPEEYLPKIFDMFFKVDPSSDGTGLGLHIVKLTIEKLGGKLQVRSRVKEGSTFILTLPT